MRHAVMPSSTAEHCTTVIVSRGCIKRDSDLARSGLIWCMACVARCALCVVCRRAYNYFFDQRFTYDTCNPINPYDLAGSDPAKLNAACLKASSNGCVSA